jgi:hypothetical protein
MKLVINSSGQVSCPRKVELAVARRNCIGCHYMKSIFGMKEVDCHFPLSESVEIIFPSKRIHQYLDKARKT